MSNLVTHHRYTKENIQRFLTRLLMSTAEQLLPTPIAFSYQILRDFKETFYTLNPEVRDQLSDQVGELSLEHIQQIIEVINSNPNIDEEKRQVAQASLHSLLRLIKEQTPSHAVLQTYQSHLPVHLRDASTDQLAYFYQKPKSHISNERKLIGQLVAQTWLGSKSSRSKAFGSNRFESSGVEARAQHNELRSLPQIPGFELTPQPLGAGAQSTVYLARPLQPIKRSSTRDAVHDSTYSFPHHSVAIKVGDLSSMSRFQREVNAMRAITHPHLSELIDAGVIGALPHPQKYWIAMPNYGGITLSDLIETGVSLEQGLTLLLQCLEGLSALHQHQLTHRDLKPANLLITQDFTLKVSDFGLARESRATQTLESLDPPQTQRLGKGSKRDKRGKDKRDKRGRDKRENRGSDHLAPITGVEWTQTEDYQLLGTPAYMSPEQIHGQRVHTPSDVWSFGVILYQLITGELPFKGNNHAIVWKEILTKKLDFTHPKIPKRLTALLDACFKEDPQHRIQSAMDILSQYKEDLLYVIDQERHQRHQKGWVKMIEHGLISQFVQDQLLRYTIGKMNPSEILSDFKEAYPNHAEVNDHKLSEILVKSIKIEQRYQKQKKRYERAQQSYLQSRDSLSGRVQQRMLKAHSYQGKEELLKDPTKLVEIKAKIQAEEEGQLKIIQNKFERQKREYQQCKHQRDRLLQDELAVEFKAYEAALKVKEAQDECLQLFIRLKTRYEQRAALFQGRVTEEITQEIFDQLPEGLSQSLSTLTHSVTHQWIDGLRHLSFASVPSSSNPSSTSSVASSSFNSLKKKLNKEWTLNPHWGSLTIQLFTELNNRLKEHTTQLMKDEEELTSHAHYMINPSSQAPQSTSPLAHQQQVLYLELESLKHADQAYLQQWTQEVDDALQHAKDLMREVSAQRASQEEKERAKAKSKSKSKSKPNPKALSSAKVGIKSDDDISLSLVQRLQLGMMKLRSLLLYILQVCLSVSLCLTIFHPFYINELISRYHLLGGDAHSSPLINTWPLLAVAACFAPWGVLICTFFVLLAYFIPYQLWLHDLIVYATGFYQTTMNLAIGLTGIFSILTLWVSYLMVKEASLRHKLAHGVIYSLAIHFYIERSKGWKMEENILPTVLKGILFTFMLFVMFKLVWNLVRERAVATVIIIVSIFIGLSIPQLHAFNYITQLNEAWIQMSKTEIRDVIEWVVQLR